MEISLITPENREYFEKLFPDNGERVCDIELGAIDEGIPCGILLSDIHKEVLAIRWFYVDPEYWGEGAGSELINSLNLMARTLDIKMTTISYGNPEYESELESFLENQGFDYLDDDSDFFVMKLKDMEAFYEETESMKKRFTGNIIPLRDITNIIWNKLRDHTERGIDHLSDHMILMDKRSDYDGELSFIIVDDHNEPTGCILVQSQEDELTVSYLLNIHGDRPMDSISLVYHSIREARKRFSPETTVYMKTVSDAGRAAVERVSANHAKPLSRIKTKYIMY